MKLREEMKCVTLAQNEATICEVVSQDTDQAFDNFD